MSSVSLYWFCILLSKWQSSLSWIADDTPDTIMCWNPRTVWEYYIQRLSEKVRVAPVGISLSAIIQGFGLIKYKQSSYGIPLSLCWMLTVGSVAHSTHTRPYLISPWLTVHMCFDTQVFVYNYANFIFQRIAYAVQLCPRYKIVFCKGFFCKIILSIS